MIRVESINAEPSTRPVFVRIVTASPAPTEALSPLSRELTELLTDMSVALHKYGMYPDGHPLLESAIAGMGRRMKRLLEERQEISIGVARRQLIIDGMASDAGNAVLRDLASRLFRREIGGLRFSDGVTDDQLTGVLTFIARESARVPDIGTSPWLHVELTALTYDQLRLSTGEGPSAPGPDRESWAAQLWQRLARSALTGEQAAISGGYPIPESVAALAREIQGRAPEGGFAQRMFRFFREITGAIREKGGAAANALSARIADLIRSLPPAALERILRLGGDSKQRRELLRGANQALPVDTVLDMARVVAASSNHTMSEALLLLLSKLAKHAHQGDSSRRNVADEALRANMKQLIDDWDGAATLPEDEYWQTLEKLIDDPSPPTPTPSAYAVPPENLVQMSLDVEVFGISTKAAVAELVREGRIAPLIAMVDGASDSNKVVWTLRRHLDNTRTIRRLLQDSPIDFDVLHRLVSRVGFPAASALLDALEAEDDRGSRYKLFEMLAGLGPEVGQAVVKRLPGAPWYMQRNLLLLLEQLTSWPPEFTPLPYTKHSDPRVRLAAYGLLLNDPLGKSKQMRDEAICNAFKDPDERVARAGLNAALQVGCPRDAMPLLTAALAERRCTGMLGVLAIKVLAPVKLPEVKTCLVRLCIASKRRWFKRVLAARSPEMLAALTVLARQWQGDPDVGRVLALAERSKDLEVQRAIRPRSAT